ncbi:DNA repair protein RadA, partial [Candidatus Daviesbacteria bacterium]|nr:DNA repair protein RadA [Candidatus Daviesbacteria bacterium]
MSKVFSSYICQQCGYKSTQYLGKCPQCDSWNSFVETVEEGQRSKLKGQKYGSSERAEIIDLSKIHKTDYQRIDTGFEEFNRCLGGGIVAGSLVLVSGDPGIGKSTLLTQLALRVKNGKSNSALNALHPTLYVAGEESAQQIKIRVDRIQPGANISVLNEVDVDNIISSIESFRPNLVIVDSIQTLETTDLESIAGSVGQVRECAHRLQMIAKALHTAIFLVGHVTKEGTIAGPRTLEHLVDVILSLEGEANSQFRVLRSTKNRFGPTDEVGVFEMEDKGMIEVKNPSKLFLEQKVEAPGSVVVSTLTGLRPLLVEIQALVTKTNLPIPRRTG